VLLGIVEDQVTDGSIFLRQDFAVGQRFSAHGVFLFMLQRFLRKLVGWHTPACILRRDQNGFRFSPE
jgi:hypothetical protein